MSIQLLCVSHKTADTKIRGLFASSSNANRPLIFVSALVIRPQIQR